MSSSEQDRNVSDADKQKLEQLRVAYENAQKTNTNVDQAREAYQDLAVKLLVNLSGKLDVTPGPGPGSDDGYVKPGGWGASPDPNGWKVSAMTNPATEFKVVDGAGKNVATNFKTQAGAQVFIDKAKAVPGGCPSGQHMDPATGKCVADSPAPSGNKDSFGVLKIYADKPGGATNTAFVGKEMTRHYASGKPSEDSYEYTCKASSPDHNSDIEFTCYEKINGFKDAPDTISDKLTGPEHQDGAKSWVIGLFRTDGSTADTFETEYPHPTYQKINPKPATSIGGSIVGKWFGHKMISYVKGGKRWVESWIHFPVNNIDNVAAEQDQWRQYVKPMTVEDRFIKANGTLTTSRLDGIKKGSPPDFKYTSTREISPDSGGGPPEPNPEPNPPPPTPTPNPTPGKQVKARMAIAEMVGNTYDVYYAATEEIIEDMTNPYTNSVDPAGWVNGSDDEICDACNDDTFMKNGEPLTYPNGAFGSPYYSNSDGNCVIPGVGTKGGYSGKGAYKNTGKLPVIPAADVFIIFWGVSGSWDSAATGPRSVAHITKTLTDLFTASDYVSGLKQYGVTGPINVIGHTVDTTTPMTPKYDFIKGTTQVIQKAINEKKAPTTSTNKIIYLVVTDAIKGQKSNQAPNTGDHSEITLSLPQ